MLWDIYNVCLDVFNVYVFELLRFQTVDVYYDIHTMWLLRYETLPLSDASLCDVTLRATAFEANYL